MKIVIEVADLMPKGKYIEDDEWWSYDQVKQIAQEYAKEILADYDNWKAHKTPDLVKQYIKEKGL